ncbi:biotin transporter BioY [Leptolyngbya sp. FACHB-17]|nr:biotin transporter BioY [Leptolyngbya sp. FACHB-17]MBD2080535.1 biotin transporter BioY [Leptolyngbya sp. FACHB-17]
MTRTPSRRPPARSRPRFRITITDLMWALIGLMLTIGGTLLRASIVGLPWASQSVPLYFLGVSYQIGAVLLVGCLGGKNAAIMSQIAYLTLGLAGLPVFSQGGGLQYVSAPSFGYLLGFVPGAWICGYLAFKTVPRLETLAFSALCGLFVIHLVGILYLLVGSVLRWVDLGTASIWQAFLTYSVNLLPGQLAVTCAIAVLALVLRRIMFY